MDTADEKDNAIELVNKAGWGIVCSASLPFRIF